MAQKAKAARKPGAGKSVKDQINSMDPEKQREAFDKFHAIQDEQDEQNAVFRGRLNRAYDSACKDLDVTKEALKMVYQEERSDRKKAAKAAKMDTRGRDSLARFGATVGGSLGDWATRMSKQSAAVPVESETRTPKGKKAKKAKSADNVVQLKKPAPEPEEEAAE